MKINVLFVCSKNKWRSPTAEKVFSKHAVISPRSRGTGRDARQKISSSDIEWADIVFVMEEKHKKRVLKEFPEEVKLKELYVLDIPDDYRYMDDELVDIFNEFVPSILHSRLLSGE